jgi:hypothetical protein
MRVKSKPYDFGCFDREQLERQCFTATSAAMKTARLILGFALQGAMSLQLWWQAFKLAGFP